LGNARATWAAVALADKLDTLVGLFLAGERPTGSGDPFGMRRQAHGILRILADAEPWPALPVRVPLEALLRQAAAGFSLPEAATFLSDMQVFLTERLQFFFE